MFPLPIPPPSFFISNFIDLSLLIIFLMNLVNDLSTFFSTLLIFLYLGAVLSHSVVSNSLQPFELARLLCPWRFSRQEYWSGLPFHPPGDIPNSGIEPRSTTLQADSLLSEPPGKTALGYSLLTMLW